MPARNRGVAAARASERASSPHSHGQSQQRDTAARLKALPSKTTLTDAGECETFPEKRNEKDAALADLIFKKHSRKSFRLK